jgi:uncharacterized membrane protein YraQ (UPF0718 family)
MNWIGQSLAAAALMFWETLWALVLGFGLSACVQIFFRREQISRHFGRAGLREVVLAMFLGAASSSCSYAATATARSFFKKGAALVPTLAFMFASTNLVFELGFLLWLLLGWPFVLAEIIGAFILVAVMWLLVRLTLPKDLEETARSHSSEEVKSCCGGCHGSEMEMDEEPVDEPFRQKIRRRENWSRVADAFFMDAGMLWKEMTIGFLAAGFLMVLVPDEWWGKLFITQEAGWLRLLENAVVGPLIGVISFACSCGNIPLASVLWSGGISFGGVIAFIYADLIILPLILIYRKYYGNRAALYITGVLFASMVSAGIIVDLLFSGFGLIPNAHPAHAIAHATFEWNYTTWLDLAAIALCGWFGVMRWKGKR